MSLLTFFYTAQTNSNFTNPTNAVDGNTGTYAYATLAPLSSSYLRGTTHSNPVSEGDITKVEIGSKAGRTAGLMSMYAYFGSTQSAESVLLGSVATTWLDITDDANGPGDGNWTWSDINAIDNYINFNTIGSGGTGYVYALYLRVTYTPVGGEGSKIVLHGDSSDHGGTITAGTTTVKAEGKLVVIDGDILACPIHGNSAITAGATKTKAEGEYVVIDGDQAACGATIISSATKTYVE